ncbi:hypothetical protein Syun_001578 [Stephania yunnanensis]|uniref:Cationic amino acid transporter C-terminal domain-containing protein n=1 Tax=Stephania yunnanensis TaxID=152371 RepID=A0AAP0LE34_9MAGN
MGLDDADYGVKAWGFRCLMRRKQVDSVRKARADARHQLVKRLTSLQLIAIGVGSTIGAGVYVLVGTVAREHSGPALTISFLIAGIAAAFSAFCYAELASRCPSAGSAYHYSYICVGEGVAWIIGWALVLEYTIGGATVARGISPNLALFFGGGGNLPFFLGRVYIPWLNVVADPCAALLVLIVTCLLCLGIKESSLAQAIVTTANVCVLAFVIIAGAYLGFRNGWPGYEIPSGYFPYGVKGMLAGAATVFFAYIGFDTVASTAEEVKAPHRDLPLGIGVAVFICCSFYMLVSIVVVGLVPYYAMDPDTPISFAFGTYKMHWVMYIISVGAVMALCSTLLGSLLPQPRVLMAMARDGLLPSFFADINKHTHVPVNSTIVTGIFASLLTFFMDVSQLAGMVSVGTLLAFTIVAISILILRYVPPDEVPVQASFHVPTDSASHQYGSSSSGDRKSIRDPGVCLSDSDRYLHGQSESSVEHPLISKMINQGNKTPHGLNEKKRRKIAAWSIALACMGVLLLTSASLTEYLPGFSRMAISGIGGMVLLCGLIVLSKIDQDVGRHSFGHTGGFICPFVPFLPVSCILINVYLLMNLSSGTWIRVSVWLILGALIYLFYGRNHSLLQNAVYVPTAHAEEIYRRSSEFVA